MKNLRRFVTLLWAMCMILTTPVVYAAPVTPETVTEDSINISDNDSGDTGIMPYSMYNGQWISATKTPTDYISVTAPRRTGKIYGTFKIESDDPYAEVNIVGITYPGVVQKTVQARNGEVKFEFSAGLLGPQSYTFQYLVHNNPKGLRINIWLY